MKKLLIILGAIGLTAISTTSLISCEKPNNNIPCKKENHGNWKQQCSNEKPFNTVDNKYYFVVWRGNENNNWRIVKFKNKNEQRLMKFDEQDKYYIKIGQYNEGFDISINKYPSSVWTLKPWQKYNGTYFKAVYRWDGVGEPSLPEIDKNTSKITDWKN